MPIATEPQTDLLTVPDVVHIINSQVSALFTSQGRLGRIRVTGRLGTLKTYPNASYSELRAASGSGDALSLEIPSRIPAKNFEGKEVEVTGFLIAKAKNRLEVQLQVTDLVNASGMNQAQLEEDKALRAIFGKANQGPDFFPSIGGNLMVTFIHGRTSQVKADFLEQLQGCPQGAMRIEPIEVNITDPASIREGLGRTQGQVICILRGGGGDGEFEVFNHPALLEAWRDKDAFKITALGHTQNTTLLDRFSHKVSNTPTEAGKWLVEQVMEQASRIYWQRQAEGAGKDSAAALQKANEEAAKRFDEMQRQHREALEKANVENTRRLEELQRQSVDTVKRLTEEASKREEQQQATFERIQGESARNQGALQDQVKTLYGEKEGLARQLATLKTGRAPLPRWVWAALAGAALLGLLGGWILAR